MKKQIVLIMMVVSMAWAALPPLDVAIREQSSTHIFKGVVQGVTARLIGYSENSLQHQDWEYEAQILITEVQKGEVRKGQHVVVHYWKPARRAHGWTGPQGQNMLPMIGDKGIFFVSYDLKLLQPNGWEMIQEETEL